MELGSTTRLYLHTSCGAPNLLVNSLAHGRIHNYTFPIKALVVGSGFAVRVTQQTYRRKKVDIHVDCRVLGGTLIASKQTSSLKMNCTETLDSLQLSAIAICVRD